MLDRGGQRPGRLLVLALLGLAACSDAAPDQDRSAQARADLAVIVEALEGYHELHGEYPEALTPLVRPDAEGNHFLSAGTAATFDPWGGAYVYTRSGSDYRLVCLGSDGAPGGAGAAADIDAVDGNPSAE